MTKWGRYCSAMDKGVQLLEGGAGILGRQKQQMSMSYSNSENTCHKMLSKNSRLKIVSMLWLLHKILNSCWPGVKRKLINKITTTKIGGTRQWFSSRNSFPPHPLPPKAYLVRSKDIFDCHKRKSATQNLVMLQNILQCTATPNQELPNLKCYCWETLAEVWQIFLKKKKKMLFAQEKEREN